MEAKVKARVQQHQEPPPSECLYRRAVRVDSFNDLAGVFIGSVLNHPSQESDRCPILKAHQVVPTALLRVDVMGMKQDHWVKGSGNRLGVWL
ncbi:hypothetical protein ILYODFUR_028165 [Ilyodon furcidens]|uniref:Uncharacterized protein n=1 Tax=Ilyodon furcidens TaxID=33524 RepID=A0ABV0SQ81_9TELE